MYQRIQCTNNYFFKIKFVFFLYLLLSPSWKENNLSWYISVIRQTVGYRTPVFIQPFSWHIHITNTYNLPHLRLICWRCHSNSINIRGRLPNISDSKTRKRLNMIGIDMIRNNHIVVYRRFESWSSQTKDYIIGIRCFSAKYAAIRRKSKD